MDNTIALDFMRGIHLFCIVVGMGPAIYYDVRSIQRIAAPLAQTDIDELHRIHHIVTIACFGLWLSGTALIWVRTSFDLSSFSPKIWIKLSVVTLLTVNAIILSFMMIPAMSRHVGQRLVDLPVRLLLPMTICAGVSFSCWLLALILGASVTLKTADWNVLGFVVLDVAAICMGGAVAVMFGLRALLRRRSLAPTQSSGR